MSYDLSQFVLICVEIFICLEVPPMQQFDWPFSPKLQEKRRIYVSFAMIKNNGITMKIILCMLVPTKFKEFSFSYISTS